MTSAHTTGFRRSRRIVTPRLKGRAPGRPWVASVAALTLAILVIFVAAPQAQQAASAPAPVSPALAAAVSTSSATPTALLDAPTDVDLLVGRSTVLNVGSTIARVSLTVPDIADAMVTAPSQLLIHGKQPGTISLFVWDRAGAIRTFEVKVRRDLTPLAGHLKQLFPTESITVMGSGKDVVISGTVSSKYVIEKAAEVAGGYVEKKENVVNLLQQQEGVASNQVMLRVRFAEVSRSALQELGASFVLNGARSKWFGRATTGQFPAPEWDEQGRLVFSDFLNLFVLNTKDGLGGVIRALQNKGLFQSLAEPNLIATNGSEASFLAGGEYPYPIAQPAGSGVAFTIMFKEFGVRLNFTPTVLGGDLINIKVRPEVSALDFANAVTLQGFRIPALSTRRTETEVELRDGQTFAIAGLMNNTLTDTMSKIPGIGDIPILGMLFRSKAHQKNQTELVVMITPQIVRRGSAGVSEGLPSLVEPYLGAPDKTHPNPDPYVGSPRYQPNQPAPRSLNEPQGVPTPAALPAANHVQQVTPSGSLPQPAAPGRPEPFDPAQSSGGNSATPQPMSASAQSMAPSGVVPDGPGEGTGAATQSLTRAQIQAVERAREEERRAADEQRRADAAAEKLRVAQAKLDAERQRIEAKAEEARLAEQAKKDAEQRRQAQKIEQERLKREAEVAKKNAEQARREADEEQKRQKAIADAALRLKQAQDAYQAEIERAKGGSR